MKKSALRCLPIILLLASCGGNHTDNSGQPEATEQTSSKASATDELINNPSKPANQNFTRQDFEGMGTIELPTGPDWQKEGNKLINEKSGMIIVVQSQQDNMIGVEKDYLNSYNDVNIRDAEGWKRGEQTLGKINGVKGARTEGTFNNGTEMVTRDYVFFGIQTTTILQTRISAANADQLAPMADYIAGSFKQQ